MSAACSHCSAPLGAFELARLLPLPSISWKEFSQDWFCACVHGPDPEATRPQAPKNREMAANSLQPRPGDVLFAPGFFCTPVSPFESTLAPTGKALLCPGCDADLGILHGTTCQFWQHAVSFAVAESAIKVTFSAVMPL